MGNRKGWNSVNNTGNKKEYKDGEWIDVSEKILNKGKLNTTSWIIPPEEREYTNGPTGTVYSEPGVIGLSHNEHVIPEDHIEILFGFDNQNIYTLGESISLFWINKDQEYRDYIKGGTFDISCMYYKRTSLLEKQMIQARKDAGFLIPDIYSSIYNYVDIQQKITPDFDNQEIVPKKKNFPHKKGDTVLLLIDNKLEAYGIENIWGKSMKLFGIDISKTMYVRKQWFIEHFYEKITLK